MEENKSNKNTGRPQFQILGEDSPDPQSQNLTNSNSEINYQKRSLTIKENKDSKTNELHRTPTEDDFLTNALDDLLFGFVDSTGSKTEDEIIKMFIQQSEDKVIPSKFSELQTFYFKGNRVDYFIFESEEEESILDYIDNSGDPAEYMKIFDNLLQYSILVGYKNEPERLEVIKSKQSKYTIVPIMILLDKTYSPGDLMDVVMCSQIHSLYISGEISEEQLDELMKEYE